MQNGYMESFNGKLRDECLNEHVFASLAEARRIIEAWRIDYNEVRPHSSLGYQTPEEFAAAWADAERHAKAASIAPDASACHRARSHQGQACGGAKSAVLDTTCARRRERRAAGTEEWLRRGRTKEWGCRREREQIQLMTGGKSGSRSRLLTSWKE